MADFKFTATRGYDVDDGNEVYAMEGLTVTYGESDNLVSNGDFSDGTTGWTASAATLSVVDGKLKIKNTSAGGNGEAKQTISTDVGSYYHLIADADYFNTSMSLAVTGFGGKTITSDGRYIFPFKATSTSHEIILQIGFGSTNYYGYFDNIAVYKVELLGADDSELHDDANAASTINEANATTGWTTFGLDVFESQASIKSDGSYALHGHCNTVPSEGGRFTYDIGAISDISDGDMVKVSFAWRHVGTGGDWVARLGSDASGAVPNVILGTVTNTDTSFATITFTLKYDSNKRYLAFKEYGVTNDGGVYVDALSIKKTTELVENGIFLDGSDATEEGWSLGTGYSISGGLLVGVSVGIGVSAGQTIGITAGQKYLVTYTSVNFTGGSFKAVLGGASGTSHGSDATWYEVITAGTANSNFSIESTATFTCDFDNISVVPLVDDISATDFGAGIYGEIHKVPVAVGSNVCALGNFSTTNYIEQPYTSALDFGTGDFSFCVWAMTPDVSTGQFIFNRDSVSTAQRFALQFAANGSIVFRADDGTTDRTCTSDTIGMDDGVFRFFSGTYDGSEGTLSLYLNGSLAKTTTGSALNTISNTSAVLRIGLDPQGANALSYGQVSQLRFYDTLLTASEIQAIYDNEKHLFKRYSYHTQIGTEYFLQKGLVACTQMIDDKSTIINGLDGITDEVVNHYTSTMYDVTTNYIDFTEIQPWRELVNATKAGETLTFKAGGRFEPNEDTATRRLSFQTTEDREGITGQLRISMKLKDIS